MKRRCGLLLSALALAAVCAGLLLAAGAWFTRPALREVGPPPPDLAAQAVRIGTPDGRFVAGWFVAGRPGSGAVLLLHAVRGDRRQMLPRARSLSRLGYALLLVDLPAHGESPGGRITFGANESAGAAAALGFLQRRVPGERVGVVAVSLGAAALVLARPQRPPDAVVLESMYPTIDDATANRLALHLGPAAQRLAPLLLWPLPLLTGVDAQALRPVDRLAGLRAPLLLASGAQDRHTTWAETERLFAAALPPRRLWRIDAAAHVDLHAFDPAAYERTVFGFLAQHLRGR